MSLIIIIIYTYNFFHYNHHVPEGLGVSSVPWSSKWSWSLHLFFGRPFFLLVYIVMLVLVFCLCCSHFCLMNVKSENFYETIRHHMPENSNPYSHRHADWKSCTGISNIFCTLVYLHYIFEYAESIWFHMSYCIHYEFCLVRSSRFSHSPSKFISPFLSCI